MGKTQVDLIFCDTRVKKKGAAAAISMDFKRFHPMFIYFL